MARGKKQNKIPGSFVAITYEMIESKAFKELNSSSLKSLILCMRKVKTYDPIDRFKLQFSLTYPEANKQGLWDSAFSRGIKQLQQLGFIDCVMKGGMRFQGKANSLYRLSQRWKRSGMPDFQKQHEGYCETVHGERAF